MASRPLAAPTAASRLEAVVQPATDGPDEPREGSRDRSKSEERRRSELLVTHVVTDVLQRAHPWTVPRLLSQYCFRYFSNMTD